jgi:hypothetical protein
MGIFRGNCGLINGLETAKAHPAERIASQRPFGEFAGHSYVTAPDLDCLRAQAASAILTGTSQAS